jgi:DNA-binding transcriptional MocR family regulator
LESIGRVYSQMGSGTYVSKALPQADAAEAGREDYINFAGSETDANFFPSEAFGQCIDEIIKKQGKSAFNQAANDSYPSLRNELANINEIEPNRIILLTDIQQGLDMLRGISPRVHAEEDMYGDFYYDGVPRPPLSGSRRNYAVIKSYAKIFLPGLAYMVIPENVVEKIVPPVHCPASVFIQRAFALFLHNGGFDEHAANMRIVYGKRYRKAIAAARVYLSDYADFDEPKHGLSIKVYPKNYKGTDIENLCRRALQRKVILSPLPSMRGGLPFFKISLASVQEENIAEGMGIIAAVMAEGVR